MISRFPRFFFCFLFFLIISWESFSNGFLEKLKVFASVLRSWISLEHTPVWFCPSASSSCLSVWFFENFAEYFLFCVWVFFYSPVDIGFCTEIQVLEQGWWNGSFLSKGKYSSHRGRSNLIQAPVSFRGELQQGCYVLSALCKALTGCRRVDSTASGGHNGWCWNLWKKRTDLYLEVPGIGGDQLLIFPHKSSSWSWIKIDTVSSSSQLEVGILHALSILWVSPNCCSKHQAIG